jgi:hypothetical protein
MATACGLPSLRGVPVHHDLIGSEAGARRSEIIDRAARMRPQHGRARVELFAGALMRAPAMAYGMRCQYFRYSQVSSEKHGTAAEAGVEDEGRPMSPADFHGAGWLAASA